MSKRKKHTLCAATWLLLTVSPSIYAENLEDIYRLARESDARLGAAEFQYQAALQAKPQARAAILPQVSLKGGFERKDLDYSSANAMFRDGSFNRLSYGLRLEQSLYNRESSVRIDQADIQLARAEANIHAARQELLVRVAEAYFNVLSANDSLEFARAEKEAVTRQLEQTRQRFEVGMIAITDVRESEAAYDLALAQEIDAVNQIDIARENLRQIIGQNPPALNALKAEFELPQPEPADIDKWVETAMQNSLALRAAEQDAALAQQEVERRRSTKYPTLGLTASHGMQDDDGGVAEGRATDTTLGVGVTLPLYTGGLTSAQIAEAQSLHGAAQKNLELQKRDSTQQARASYLNVQASISRAKALKQALESTRTAAEATRAGFEVGTRTSVEVLGAERDQYRAQSNYARARYDAIINSFRLKQAAGTLSEADLLLLNKWL
ncbi:MAG: TolC family outer membrane protein [Thiotrichales bacterium]